MKTNWWTRCTSIQVGWQGVLNSTYIHIRSSSACSHVMEHTRAFRVSSPLFIECHTYSTFGQLWGSSAAMEVGTLNLGSDSVWWILSPVGRRLLATLLNIGVADGTQSFLSSASHCCLSLGACCLNKLLLVRCHSTLSNAFSLILTLHAFVKTHASFAHHLLLTWLVILLLHLANLSCCQVVCPVSTRVGRKSFVSWAKTSIEGGWCLLAARSAYKSTGSTSCISWMAQMSLDLSLRLTCSTHAQHTYVHTLLLLSLFDLHDIWEVSICKTSSKSSLINHLSTKKLSISIIARIFLLSIDHHLLTRHSWTTSSLIIMVLLSLLNLTSHHLLLYMLRHILKLSTRREAGTHLGGSCVPLKLSRWTLWTQFLAWVLAPWLLCPCIWMTESLLLITSIFLILIQSVYLLLYRISLLWWILWIMTSLA